jgi:hypothetical protein
VKVPGKETIPKKEDVQHEDEIWILDERAYDVGTQSFGLISFSCTNEVVHAHYNFCVFLS